MNNTRKKIIADTVFVAKYASSIHRFFEMPGRLVCVLDPDGNECEIDNTFCEVNYKTGWIPASWNMKIHNDRAHDVIIEVSIEWIFRASP